MADRMQLRVEYADHQRRYFPVERGWRIDAASRCIVIGGEPPRTYVPLDGITDFTVERVRQGRAAPGCCLRAAETLGAGHDDDCPAAIAVPRAPATGPTLDRAAGVIPPHPPEEMVWLGDLSGYEIGLDNGGDVFVSHHCGWAYAITNPVRGYLANLLDGPVAEHRRAGCGGEGA